MVRSSNKNGSVLRSFANRLPGQLRFFTQDRSGRKFVCGLGARSMRGRPPASGSGSGVALQAQVAAFFTLLSNRRRAESTFCRLSDAHSHTPQNAALSVRPSSVILYSTFGGTTG
jgi:hypothetical protein